MTIPMWLVLIALSAVTTYLFIGILVYLIVSDGMRTARECQYAMRAAACWPSLLKSLE